MKSVPGAFYLWQLAIGAAVVAGLVLSFTAWQWDLVKSGIRRAHPGLMQLPTHELAIWLDNPRARRPLLLDTRSREEFAVSHIAGARRVPPDAQPGEIELPEMKDAPIVTYCSVGNRSAALAERLRLAGYTRIYQLDGALFKWANEDRAIVNDAGPALTVHPHNRQWEHLLKEERRAVVAPLP